MSKWMFEMLPERAFSPRAGGGMALCGGKGSSAPPPDPRLVAAQLESMGVQNSAIQQVMANAQRLAPMQEEQMRLGIQRGNVGYEQSQADRTYTLGRRDLATGLQDRMVADASAFNLGERTNQMLGEASADVNAAFSGARDQQVRGMSRMGVNPASGRMAGAGNQMAIAQASAQAGAAAKMRQAAKAEGFALTDRASNALSGFPAMSMGTAANSAGLGAAGLGLANSGMAGLNAGWNTAGGMAGQMGQNATSMYGAQASYKNQQDQIAASNDPFNTILGAAAGIGTQWALGKVG